MICFKQHKLHYSASHYGEPHSNYHMESALADRTDNRGLFFGMVISNFADLKMERSLPRQAMWPIMQIGLCSLSN